MSETRCLEFVSLRAATAIYLANTFSNPDGFTRDYLESLIARGLLTGRQVDGDDLVEYRSLCALIDLDLEANLRREREELDGEGP